MKKIKEGIEIDSVIIQEGIPTIDVNTVLQNL
nr:hypothetical protein [Wolbachia endosymbiont of Atemnus politus]